jgi:hypothetical protein
MDIGQALGFVFEDEEWIKKLLLGAVIMLIPIFGGFAILGYAIAVVRNIMASESKPLPAWENLGGYFMDGLMFWVATLVYAIPLLVLMCPAVAVWALPLLGGEQEDLTTMLAGVSGVVTLGLGCLASLYGIVLALLVPVLQIRYAESGELGACLRFGEVFHFLFANIGGIIISQLLMWAAGIVIGLVIGGLAAVLNLVPICGQILSLVLSLLMLPVYTWLMVFAGHLYGQVGQRAGVVPVAA